MLKLIKGIEFSKIFKRLFLVIIMIKSLHREIISNIDWQNSAEGKCRSPLLKVSRKQLYASYVRRVRRVHKVVLSGGNPKGMFFSRNILMDFVCSLFQVQQSGLFRNQKQKPKDNMTAISFVMGLLVPHAKGYLSQRTTKRFLFKNIFSSGYLGN